MGAYIVSVDIALRMASIKALAFDVDGVLTDGGVWWNARSDDSEADEWKRFSFIDIMGVARAKRAGLLVTLISGENSVIVDRFASKMSIADYTKGCTDKAAALREYAVRHSLDLRDVCFMGDDVNDLEAMAIAGLAASPSDGRDVVRKKAAFVSSLPGGNGAVRELIEAIISAREREEILG